MLFVSDLVHVSRYDASDMHVPPASDMQTAIMLINRRQFLLLLPPTLICYLVVYAYLLSHTDLHLQHAIYSLAGTSQQQQHAYNVINVQSVGNFVDRVSGFNAFLSSFRLEELKRRGTMAWQTPASNNLTVVRSVEKDYLTLMSNYVNVTTVVLPRLNNSSFPAVQNSSNLLILTYFEWTADDAICSWIENHYKTRKLTCNKNINDTRPAPLQLSYDNAKYVFYMHIHRDAIDTSQGVVITDGLKLIMYGCEPNENQIPSKFDHVDRIPLYDEVFVLCQGIWGRGTFHRLIEIVPKIALLVDFLKANPEIRIMAPQAGGRLEELLRIIGLDNPKLVTKGSRAKIVYQPRATLCGHPNAQESQMLSHLFHNYIKEALPPEPRNRLILIRRSRSRRFSEQSAIEEVLTRAAMDYNLTFTLFIDNPSPSLNDTMVMFHSAVIIVGPHGAGLSNMLFSQPGTYVVEVMCNVPWINLCYQRLAYVLGHHWHGLTAQSRFPRVHCRSKHTLIVSPLYIDAVVREYLRMWSSHIP